MSLKHMLYCILIPVFVFKDLAPGLENAAKNNVIQHLGKLLKDGKVGGYLYFVFATVLYRTYIGFFFTTVNIM